MADAETLARVILDYSGRRHIIEVGEQMIEDAYQSESDYETILERAESGLASVPTESRDDVQSLMQIRDFIGLEIPEPDWVIPNLLARGERMILTGEEGLGKSTLIRQLAMCGSAGMEPFTGNEIPRIKVLLIDAENPSYIMQKRLSEIRQAINAHGGRDSDIGWLDREPRGLDLGRPATGGGWLTGSVR